VCSCICRVVDDAFGFVILRRLGLFPCPTNACPTRPSTEAVMPRLQASHEGSSPEFLRVPPARTFRWALVYQGFWPSSRHPQNASTYRGGSQASTTFRPQAFSASRRFAPRLVFAGLFHPAATSRVDRLSRDFSPHAAPLSFRRARPPCRFVSEHSPAEAGCHTRKTPTTRLSSTRGSVVRAVGISHDHDSLPSSGSSLLQAPSRTVFANCLAPSALDVAAPSLRFRARSVRPTPAYCQCSTRPTHL